MAIRDTGSVRALALVGPTSYGKTALMEALLEAATGQTVRPGEVGDSSPEAKARGHSVELNLAGFEFMGDRNVVVDCPGSLEFCAEIDPALPAVDLAIVAPSASQLSTFLQVLMIDLVLAGDNAVAVGLAAAGLPHDQRRKVIIYGLAAAVVVRIAFALITVQLLAMVGLLLAGGFLLLWVCWKMWRELKHGEPEAQGQEAAAEAALEDVTGVDVDSSGSIGATVAPVPRKTFASAFLQVFIADLSMSLDNVLALAGAAREHPGILVFGLLLSIALMGVAATYIAKLLHKYPWIGYVGLAIVLFVAGRMIPGLSARHDLPAPATPPERSGAVESGAAPSRRRRTASDTVGPHRFSRRDKTRTPWSHECRKRPRWGTDADRRTPAHLALSRGRSGTRPGPTCGAFAPRPKESTLPGSLLRGSRGHRGVPGLHLPAVLGHVHLSGGNIKRLTGLCGGFFSRSVNDRQLPLQNVEHVLRAQMGMHNALPAGFIHSQLDLARFGALAHFADELSLPSRELPCPLPALPTGAPLDMRRAGPVATYGWWTSPFTGKRDASHGVTLAAPAGEPVLAPGAGRVVWAGSVRERRANEWTRFGTLVILEHGGGVWTVFGHLRGVVVRRGQRVVRGERIATVGSSGCTRVPALYYEVRWPVEGASVPVDPALFNLALPLPELDARLADPRGDLSGDWAKLEHLRLAR